MRGWEGGRGKKERERERERERPNHCQTSFIKQKTLLLVGGSWNHICFQLCDPLIPLPSFPPSCLPPLIVIPLPPSFHLLCQVQQACGFPAWSLTVLYKWPVALRTLRVKTAWACIRLPQSRENHTEQKEKRDKIFHFDSICSKRSITDIKTYTQI